MSRAWMRRLRESARERDELVTEALREEGRELIEALVADEEKSVAAKDSPLRESVERGTRKPER